MPRKLCNQLLASSVLALGLSLARPAGAWAQGPGTAAPAVAVPTSAPTSPLLWLALGLAALSLLGVVVLWNKLQNTRRRLEETRRKDAASPKSAGVEAFSQKKMADLIRQEITRQMDQRVAAKQARAKVPAPPPPAPPAAALVPVVAEVEVPAPAAPPMPRVRTQYVGEAPFNNSFAARSLSDQPGTYSMFAIESSEEQPEQGTFAVTGNLASHVRDHRSVLEPVCEYVGGYPLGSETRVVTEQPGQVRRRGDDWEVTQRAKVRFE